VTHEGECPVSGSERMSRCVYYKGAPRGMCHASRSIIYPPETTPSKPAKSEGVFSIMPPLPHWLRSERWHGNHPGGPPYSKNGGVAA